MEGGNQMAKKSDKETFEEIAKKFNVSAEICEEYNRVYDENILPRIQKKYLAQLISVVEDMINEKIRKKINEEQQEEGSNLYIRRYNIVVSDRQTLRNGKAYTRSLPGGAIIFYDSRNSEKDIYKLIANELGHLLIEYKIIPGVNAKNYTDLFAHFALNEEI